MMPFLTAGLSNASIQSCVRRCVQEPMSLLTATTCPPGWSLLNMPTLPLPLSSAMKPAWSMRCLTISRGACARPNSAARPDETMAGHDDISAEERLIARFFEPIATHPGALGLADDAAFISPPPGADLVLKTDAIVGGVHFFPDDAAQAV